MGTWPQDTTYAVQLVVRENRPTQSRKILELLHRTKTFESFSRREDDPIFYVSSPALRAATTSAERQAEGMRVANLVKVVVKLEFGEELQGGGEVEVHPAGHVIHNLRVDIRGTTTIRARFAVNGMPEPDAARLLDNAYLNSKLEWVLKLFHASDQSWSWLYKILEAVEQCCGKNNAHSYFGPGKLEKFKRTANTPNAIGTEARHGHHRWMADNHPMSHEEAKQLIDGLVRWCVAFHM